MKNQILDDPFFDDSKFSFEAVLNENEKILWKGKPSTEQLFTLLDFSILGFIAFFLYILPNEFIEIILWAAFFYACYIFPKMYRIITIRSIYYAVTPSRILWSKKNNSTRETYSIDFTNIKWAEMEDNAIFIRPKDYSIVNIETRSAQTFEKRNKPTIENIKNMKEVYDLIEKQIAENNSK